MSMLEKMARAASNAGIGGDANWDRYMSPYGKDGAIAGMRAALLAIREATNEQYAAGHDALNAPDGCLFSAYTAMIAPSLPVTRDPVR